MTSNLPNTTRMLRLVEYDALVQHLDMKLKLEPNSIRLVVGRWKIFEEWLSISDIRDISQSAVDDFLYYRKYKHVNPRTGKVGCENNTLNSYVFAFRMIKSYAQAKELQWHEAFSELVSFEKEEAEIDPLTVKEIESILIINIPYGRWRGRDPSDYLNPLYRAMILVLIYTGGRYENCQRLMVKDVFVDKQILRFRDLKNHMKFLDAWVPLFVIEQLKPFLNKDPDDLVFVSYASFLNKNFKKLIAPSTFNFELRKRAIRAEIKKRVHPHIFRHCFGTRMVENGVKLENVAKMLGHKDIQSSYRYYTHVSAQFLKVEKFKDPMVMKYLEQEEVYQSVRSRLTDMALPPKLFLYVVKRLHNEFLAHQNGTN